MSKHNITTVFWNQKYQNEPSPRGSWTEASRSQGFELVTWNDSIKVKNVVWETLLEKFLCFFYKKKGGQVRNNLKIASRRLRAALRGWSTHCTAGWLGPWVAWEVSLTLPCRFEGRILVFFDQGLTPLEGCLAGGDFWILACKRPK